MENVVIVGAVRTPIGDHLGSLSSLSAVELGTLASAEVLRRAKVDPSLVDEVTAGMVYKAGVKGNPARQIQLAVHIPVKAPAMTVDQQCASAMRAFEIAADKIALGKTEEDSSDPTRGVVVLSYVMGK